MFLSSERGHSETDRYRCYNTFNFGLYQRTDKEAFYRLYVLNDDTLAGGETLRMQVKEFSEVLILPVVGRLTYADDQGVRNAVEAGECLHVFASDNTAFELTNPYPAELVNFLQLWVRTDEASLQKPSVGSFNLDEAGNALVPVIDSSPGLRCSIGKFNGRSEGMYRPQSSANALFVYVIEGAFEVQNRLLERRDGLGLTGASELEFEALSNEAMLMVVEMA